MRILVIGFLAFSLLSALTSCSYKQDQLLFEQRNRLDSASQKNAADIINYRIRPQDLLQIRNLQNINYISDAPAAESSSGGGGGASSGGGGGSGGGASTGQTFQVDEDGTVTLPVIGHVQVIGLTRQEATKKIEGLYSSALLKNPIIELKIVNLKVTILGEIKTQGNFPLLKDKTTLIEMIGQAGGLTEKANAKNIEIIRGSQTHPVITWVDMSNINSLSDPATILQNDDIIYIAQSKRAARTDNLQNFSTLVQPALIVLNTVLIILTLARR
jgi:polysaccharide export outer membrane protein